MSTSKNAIKRWKEQPAGSFGALNYCNFNYNPVLPFGQSVVFSADTALLKAVTAIKTPLLPMQSLANQLGKAITSNLTTIIATFQNTEKQYRQSLDAEKLPWMEVAAACKSNGLSAAFTGDREALADDLAFGRLVPPLYRQIPFDKCMYIRREDWAAKLFDTGLVLPIRLEEPGTIIKVIRQLQALNKREV